MVNPFPANERSDKIEFMDGAVLFYSHETGTGIYNTTKLEKRYNKALQEGNFDIAEKVRQRIKECNNLSDFYYL